MSAFQSEPLTPENISLRPNRKSLGLIMLLVLLWITSANYNNNLGYILTYLLAGMVLVSSWHTYRHLAGLEFRCAPIAPVFAGHQAQLQLEIANISAKPRYQIRIDHPGSPTLSISLASGERRPLKLALPINKRGRHKTGPIVLSSTFPLGFFQAYAILNPAQEWWIYPRPAPVRIPFPTTLGKKSDELDFNGFRPYRPGDPLRQIYWKGLAKKQKLQILCYEPATDFEHSAWLDWRATPGRDIEYRLQILCRWLLEAERSGQAYGLRLPQQTIPPDRGSPHLHRCLKALSQFPHG
ncbi:MAG: DUF58 domain-containing protein [Methylohalobius crimeensis]